MPSPMIGCASPAALPMRNRPSSRVRRTPGSSGPAASQGPSRVRRLQAPLRTPRALAPAACASTTSPARTPGRGAPRRLPDGRAGCSRPRWSGRRRRRPCRHSRRRTRARAAGRRRDRASRKFALKASRSRRGAASAVRRWRADGSASHEPCASIATRRAQDSATGPAASTRDARSASRRRRRRWPARTRAAARARRPRAPARAAACRASRGRAPGPRGAVPCAGGGRSATIVRSPRISATLRSAGPATASNASPMPSASSSGRLLAAMHSPQTLRRGKRCFSTSATDQPARASRIAAADPAGPAPTMTASKHATASAALPLRVGAKAVAEQARRRIPAAASRRRAPATAR